MIIKSLLTLGLLKLIRVKRKGIRKQSLHGNVAATVLLKLFIIGNERGYTIDAP